MKFFKILWEDLKLYYRKSRSVFLLFCICGILSSIAFLYFYANLLPAVANRDSRDAYYREITLKAGDSADPLPPETLAALQEETLIEEVTVIHTEIEDGKRVETAADLGKNPSLVLVTGESAFSEDAPYSVIVPEKSGLSVGDECTLFGKSFQVVGIHTGGDYRIPYETYQSLSLTSDMALVYAAEKKDVKSGAAERLLKGYFPENVVIEPSLYTASETAQSEGMLFQICVAYALVIVVFLFLFLFLMEETAREAALCRILGASRGWILLSRFCEVLLLSAGSFLTGILLHAVLYRPLFSKWNLTEGIRYAFRDYAMVFLLMTMITLLVSLFFIRCSTRLSPVEAMRTADF